MIVKKFKNSNKLYTCSAKKTQQHQFVFCCLVSFPEWIHEGEYPRPLLDGLLDDDGDPEGHEGLREVSHLNSRVGLFHRLSQPPEQ